MNKQFKEIFNNTVEQESCYEVIQNCMNLKTFYETKILTYPTELKFAGIVFSKEFLESRNDDYKRKLNVMNMVISTLKWRLL